jgi:hypothetical protein
VTPARASGGIRETGPFAPLAPGSIFLRDITGLPAANNQEPAKLLRNQMAYNNAKYRHWASGGLSTHAGFVNNGVGILHMQQASANTCLFIAPPNQPTRKVTLVKSGSENASEARTELENEEAHFLQNHWEAVPLPTLAKVPSGLLTSPGTDKWMTVWQPSTDRMWCFHKYAEKVAGVATADFGGFQQGVSTWNGIWTNGWNGYASGIAQVCGLITTQDLVEVLRASARGETPVIKHALIVGAAVVAAAHVPPATNNDTTASENSTEVIPAGFSGEGEPNPAAGIVDRVPLGTWVRLPPGSHPSDFGIVPAEEPVATAVFEAIRRFGMMVFAKAPNAAVAINMQYPAAEGSPYGWAAVNPLAGAVGGTNGWAPTTYNKPTGWIPESMTDSTLPHLVERISASEPGCLAKLPLDELELIEPRAS